MMPPLLSDVGEDVLLGRFRRALRPGGSLVVGPGDDCAVVAGASGAGDLLLKTDAMAAGIHFLPEECPRRVGHKALARVLSDIAAMGGMPEHLLVTLALPARTSVAWLDGFYDGLLALAGNHGCRVAGGELTGLPDGADAVISIAATGRVAEGRAILRSGGKPGDILAVTGVLGGSLASGHHLDFQPRLAEGQWLAASGTVHAMMDLSDGLARDLPRMAESSGCGFALEEECLPLRAGCTVDQAMGDGEDYELLLAVAPAHWPALAARWREHFPGVPLTAIGHMVESGGGDSPVPGAGWEHFSTGRTQPSA
jgi:thiamine-monophosphate kinase